MCHFNSRSDNLINTNHPAYHFTFPLCVYANMLILVLTLPPSLQTLYLSLILSLCRSSSYLSSPLSPSHIKMHGNLFHLSLIAIKSSANIVVSLKGLNIILILVTFRLFLVSHSLTLTTFSG
jgi:hypothetical protein